MNGTNIELKDYKLAFAVDVGVRRQLEAIRAGKKEAFGADPMKRWSNHIEGACGEMCVSEVLSISWDASVNTYREGGDVGGFNLSDGLPFIQVKTRSETEWDLLVRPGNRDEDIYVLVVGLAPKFRVVGWMKGIEAKQEKWLAEHGGRPAAYFVPQNELKDMSILKRGIHRRLSK